MANYDIPQYPTKRLRYFNNQFLSDQDFIDDDVAQIGHERAFLRSLCVAGVCEGLQVTYPAANLPPSVSAGIAIDRTGRMIVVDRATDALAKPDALADGDYFIHISFLESEDAKAVGQGASDFTRWKQTPVINAIAKSAALPDGVVVLGSCTVKNKAFVGSGTTIGRQYSGLRLPGPNQGAAATLSNSGASDDLAMLGGSLTLRRDVGGQIGPTLTLLNSAGAPGAGGAIDFNSYDPGTDDPSVRIQSIDASGFTSHLTFSTKKSGGPTNKLVERLRLTSDGLLQFPTDSTNKIVISDKIVISYDGTDRYGIGLNTSNINLFCPKTASFSLRQNSYNGTEVFSVSGSGTVTFSGSLTVGSPKGSTGNPGSGDAWIAGALQVFGSTSLSADVSAAGNMQVAKRLTANGALTFGNSTWGTYSADSTILTDNVNYKAMMIVGSNQNQNHGRWIRMWDDVAVEGALTVGNNVTVSADLTAANLWLSSGGTRKIQLHYGKTAFGEAFGIETSWVSAGLYSQGWSIASDAALKTDVVAHEPVIDRVMKLRPVRFKWKADGSQGSGFIAQEVEALFPDLVHEGLAGGATNRPIKSIVYDRFGMLAVAAIKELKTAYDARLDALERRLAAQEGKS